MHSKTKKNEKNIPISIEGIVKGEFFIDSANVLSFKESGMYAINMIVPTTVRIVSENIKLMKYK